MPPTTQDKVNEFYRLHQRPLGPRDEVIVGKRRISASSPTDEYALQQQRRRQSAQHSEQQEQM